MLLKERKESYALKGVGKKLKAQKRTMMEGKMSFYYIEGILSGTEGLLSTAGPISSVNWMGFVDIWCSPWPPMRNIYGSFKFLGIALLLPLPPYILWRIMTRFKYIS